MKWRECSQFRRHPYYTGPESTYHTARGGGLVYEVSASWTEVFARSGAVVWWSTDGKGNNKAWPTKDDAIAWCEQDAARRKAERKQPPPAPDARG